MAHHVEARGLALRPHVKTHKTPWIAEAQLAAGAQGLTCATVFEAEVMASVTNEILLAHPPVHAEKLRRLFALPDHLSLIIGVDSPDAVGMLQKAAEQWPRPVKVVAEADVGLKRVGLRNPTDVLQLAQAIGRAPSLEFAGIMFYPGHLKGATSDQSEGMLRLNQDLHQMCETLRRAGFPPAVISGGSTPTAPRFGELADLTEVRPGTYVYNDRTTVSTGACDLRQCALTVSATVVSTSVQGQAVVDAGSKALGREPHEGLAGYGEVLDHPEVVVTRMSEEHGILDLSSVTWRPRVGDLVRIIPNHVCIVVHLNDVIYGMRGEVVERGWEVAARGRGYCP